ncbi:zeta toxin family protein [Nonomuraea sp. NPDC050643]|uniref:zeta toxin family protein n=1 Tax=Nonomuraea sp. NPDC050643 TaxID=3155660 RepID=UPI0033C699AB
MTSARPANGDESLGFESALDIIGGLMAWCTARERAAPADASWRALRGRYRGEFIGLDPADHAAVARAVRAHGARLAALGGSIEVVARPSPDAYRLSSGEHARVFAETIVPEALDVAAPSPAPVVVIVAGEQGSGRTTRARQVVRDRPAPGGWEVIDPEAFLAYHPYSWDLVLHDDAAAGDRVMADALGWCALAVERAIARRADVVLEAGADRDGEVDAYAAVFRDAGYRVEVEVTAVPEAVARLRLLVRYHCRHGNWEVLEPPSPVR